MWWFCCLSLCQDLKGVIQATWPAESNLYIRQYRCLDRGWVFSERNHSFINPLIPVSIEENRKPKRNPELKLNPESKTLLHQMLHIFSLGEKLKSYDSLIWNREKMHQRTPNFRKEDTEGKQSALKENQQKTAWLQGIQSTDSNDITGQTAARLGHLLISQVFLELKVNESSTSISHNRKSR